MVISFVEAASSLSSITIGPLTVTFSPPVNGVNVAIFASPPAGTTYKSEVPFFITPIYDKASKPFWMSSLELVLAK